MISYKYSALSKDGAKVKGVIEAVDEIQAVEKIKGKCPVVLDITEIKTGGISDILNVEIGKKFDAKALSIMCSQFCIILKAGTPIDKTMAMIASQTQDKKLKRMLEKATEDVNHGSSVEQAFRKNYDGLPEVFLETVKAGEVSGSLSKAFENMQIYFDKQFKNKQKIKSVTSYPLFVLCIAIVVVIVVMVMVVPTLTSVFDSLGGDLPLITKILIHTSDWFSKYWILLIGIICALIIIIQLATNGKEGKIRKGKILLKLPIIGKINVLNAAQEFANTMATLLEAGLTLSEALRVTSKCISNDAVSTEVFAMAEKIEIGRSLAEIMNDSQYLPEVLKEMSGVGEKSGELVETLKTIGDYYSNEADYEMKSALSKLEPTMLVLLALFAGFIVIAIYLPMFTMYSLL